MDKWYKLYSNTIENIQEIISYCINHSIIYHIDVLNKDSPYIRKKANNINVDNIIKNIKDPTYFRIILRDNYILCKINKKYDMILEVGIRGIYINDNEYFIFIFCDKDILKKIKEKWKLIQM